MTSSTKTYFPNLNALRFYAALSVMLTHIPAYASFFGRVVERLPVGRFFLIGDSVTLFFVISGYLVTHSLLRAHDKPSGIDVRRYWIGRALRILPLYVFIVVITMLIFPIQSAGDAAVWTLLVMANVARAFYMTTPFVHLWSIAVEEHYLYALPLLLKRLHPIKLFVGVLIVRAVFIMVAATLPIESPVRNLLVMYQFEGFALGGLAAYAVFRRGALVAWLHAHERMIIALFIGIVLLPYYKTLEDTLLVFSAYKLVTSSILTAFIVVVTTKPNALIHLEGRVWNRLGQATYGIFIYHILLIGVLLPLFQSVALDEFGGSLLFHLTVIGISIVVGTISYQLIEKPISRLRERMTQRAANPVLEPSAQTTA